MKSKTARPPLRGGRAFSSAHKKSTRRSPLTTKVREAAIDPLATLQDVRRSKADHHRLQARLISRTELSPGNDASSIQIIRRGLPMHADAKLTAKITALTTRAEKNAIASSPPDQRGPINLRSHRPITSRPANDQPSKTPRLHAEPTPIRPGKTEIKRDQTPLRNVEHTRAKRVQRGFKTPVKSVTINPIRTRDHNPALRCNLNSHALALKQRNDNGRIIRQKPRPIAMPKLIRHGTARRERRQAKNDVTELARIVKNRQDASMKLEPTKIEGPQEPISNHHGDRIQVTAPDAGDHVDIIITPARKDKTDKPHAPASITLTRGQLHALYHRIIDSFKTMDRNSELTAKTKAAKTADAKPGSPQS
jgi:hypothetical protein